MTTNYFWKFIILLELLFIQLSIAAPNDYALILFAQQWPKTTCIQYKKPPNQCFLPQNDDWTIHGIWPSKSQERGPADCRPDLPFNAREVTSIRNQLQAKWISVHGPNAQGFWAHEWETHGTCSVDLPQLNTQLKYFQKGLDLNSQHNIRSILENAHIVPGHNYPIQDILNALNQGLGVSPQVTCIRDSGRQYLQEVRICMNKQFQLISCQGHVASITSCNSRSNVEYPSR